MEWLKVVKDREFHVIFWYRLRGILCFVCFCVVSLLLRKVPMFRRFASVALIIVSSRVGRLIIYTLMMILHSEIERIVYRFNILNSIDVGNSIISSFLLLSLKICSKITLIPTEIL